MQERTGFTAAQKKRMLISDETRLGIRITSKYTKIAYNVYVQTHVSVNTQLDHSIYFPCSKILPGTCSLSLLFARGEVFPQSKNMSRPP